MATEKELSRMPLGGEIIARCGAPYLVAHRADLQLALFDACKNYPQISFEFGVDFQSYKIHQSQISVSVVGKLFLAAALIGADGVRSHIRASVPW